MNHRDAIEHLIALGNPQTFDELSQYELPIILELIENQKCVNATLDKEAKGLNPWQVKTPWEVERPSNVRKPRRKAKDEVNREAVERAIHRASVASPVRSYRARVGLKGCSYYLGTYATKAEADEAVFRFKLGIRNDPVVD